MTDRYKESIQGARDCVERNKDGGVYLPDLLVVIDSQQTQIDTMLEDLQFRTNQVIEQQAEIERLQTENNQFADIGKMYSEIRAEAIKEFVEKFDSAIDEMKFPLSNVVDTTLLIAKQLAHKTAKEMVGDDK